MSSGWSLLPSGAQRALLTDDYLSAEHVLLALLNDKRCGRRVMLDSQPDLFFKAATPAAWTETSLNLA